MASNKSVSVGILEKCILGIVMDYRKKLSRNLDNSGTEFFMEGNIEGENRVK